MIDLHSHFLPKIDDGARSVNESIAMLEESRKQGVELCIGTPHITIHQENSIRDFLEKRGESIRLLEQKIKETKADVPALLYGAEIFLDNDISAYTDISKLCIENTNCLLVELSPLAYNVSYAEWLYSLTIKGFVPIIAHVERYPYIREFISELSGVNVVYQMNAKSLLKHKWLNFLTEINESGKRVIVASDMHNTGLRKSMLEKARHKLEKKHADIVNDVFYGIAKELIK
jgi:protein-tyrosine phosphatase